jgi:hypothetical protein
MHLVAIAILAIAALAGAWFIAGEISAGVVTSRNSTVSRADNPASFWTRIAIKALFVVFALAVLLNALGLTGDPMMFVHTTFPAFFRH